MHIFLFYINGNTLFFIGMVRIPFSTSNNFVIVYPIIMQLKTSLEET